jgi:hypothetical protein
LRLQGGRAHFFAFTCLYQNLRVGIGTTGSAATGVAGARVGFAAAGALADAFAVLKAGKFAAIKKTLRVGERGVHAQKRTAIREVARVRNRDTPKP